MEADGIVQPERSGTMGFSSRKLNRGSDSRRCGCLRKGANLRCNAPVWVWVFVWVLMLGATAAEAGIRPIPVIFDTDIGNDVDDALALAMLHALETRGEAHLLAVTITKDNKWAAPFVNLVNSFYGRPQVPIGVVKNGKTPEDSAMIRVPCERKTPDGTPVYPRDLIDGSAAPDALQVLRSALAAQPDDTVVIIQVGFSTNLARLLDTGGDRSSPMSGKELARRKVHLLCCMAGSYTSGTPEYNVRTDLAAAKKLFTEWPTPIVASGLEVGQAIQYPAMSIERDFGYVADHPIAEAYRNYKKMPYDRPTWDLTAVLYAIRADRGYFDLSPPGWITVGDDAVTRFEPSANGSRRYLIANDKQRERALEAMIYLASQPPCRGN